MSRNIALDIYGVGIVLSGGIGAIAGLTQFLTDYNLISNDRNHYVGINFDNEFPCPNVVKAIGYAPISVMYAIVGAGTGCFTGICLPVAVPMYGLIKWKEITMNNEIVE